MDAQARQQFPDALGIVDAIARVTHLWVRHLEPDTSRWSDDSHLAFLGGLIRGLCRHLDQPEGTAPWVAYAYVLLDGHGGDALRSVRRLLAASADPGLREDSERGSSEAVSIVTLISLPPGGT